jgi:hypothetical protein
LGIPLPQRKVLMDKLESSFRDLERSRRLIDAAVRDVSQDDYEAAHARLWRAACELTKAPRRWRNTQGRCSHEGQDQAERRAAAG